MTPNPSNGGNDILPAEPSETEFGTKFVEKRVRRGKLVGLVRIVDEVLFQRFGDVAGKGDPFPSRAGGGAEEERAGQVDDGLHRPR